MKPTVSLSRDHLHELPRCELLAGAGYRGESAKQPGAGHAEHARAVQDVKLPVADSLKEAKAILTDALCHNPQHDESCKARRFADHNRYLPASHPAWKSAPPCDCWVSRLAGFLKSDQLES